MEEIPEKPRIGRPPAEHPLRQRKIRAKDSQWEAWKLAGGANLSRWIRRTLDRAARRKGQ